MLIKKQTVVNILISIFIIGLINYAWADTKINSKKQNNIFSLRETGLSFGYAKGRMEHDRDYEPLILSAHFGYSINPLLNKINLKYPGVFQIDIEPFLNPILEPDRNIEFGCGFLLKYSFPLVKKLWPFAEIGTGLIYSTQHTDKQATQFNFLDQAGTGFCYNFGKNLSLSFGYRFRHYSNCDLKKPNSGIDSQAVIVGISWFY